MDTAEELRMNLASLQRIDPYIINIKESASQVALYRYSATQEWEKTETEGTLFVYERKCEPTYGFLILNRLNTNNWIQPISSEIDSQLQAPFLLYKTKDAEIFGIWFYEKEKCESVSKAIDRLAKDTEKRMNQRNKALNSSSSEGKKGTDLSSLLSNAASKGKSRSDGESKAITTLKSTKESPSGGEKLLRLLASGGASDAAKTSDTQAMNNVSLNFAQVTAGVRGAKQNGFKLGNEKSNDKVTPITYKNDVRSRQDSTNFSDDIYTEEDIKIMTGQKSPICQAKSPVPTPSTGSVAQFFAQAQAQQEQEDVPDDKKSELPLANRNATEPPANMVPHPPGAVVTGGPPGIRLPNPALSAPIQGIVPMVPGGYPGMTLLPQQPGAPPIMVPIIPSTGAHLMAQQQQIRLAVAHAQAAAAAQTARQQTPLGQIPTAMHGMIPSADHSQSMSDNNMNDHHRDASPQLPALQTLLSNPAVMSVESLERAHREESQTPPNKNEMPPIPSKATTATDLESDLKSKLNISKSGNVVQKGNINKDSDTNKYGLNMNKRTQKEEIEADEQQLYSKTDTSLKCKTINCNAKKLWSSNSDSKIELKLPLTQTQLSQAIQHLFKTDSTFVETLHVAYADSLRCKMK